MSDPAYSWRLPRKDDESEDDFFTRLRYSARGHKGHLTQSIKSVQKALDYFKAAPSSHGVTVINQAIDEVVVQHNILNGRINELLEFAKTDKEFNDYTADRDSYESEVSAIKEKAWKLLAETDLPPRAQISDRPSLYEQWGGAEEEDDESKMASASAKSDTGAFSKRPSAVTAPPGSSSFSAVATAASAAPTGPAAKRIPKANLALKPELLLSTATP